MIRVLLVGDVRLHREGLAALLARDRNLHLTATASAGDGLLPRAAAVEVVVVDATGREALDSIRRLAGDGCLIVAVGAPADPEDVIAFAESGVLGFVDAEAPLDELRASIASAARGEASCPPRIATVLLRRVTALAARPPPPDVAALTVRERQIVDLIAEGLSNKEIATRLSIEVATVKNHVHNILEKLQVSRRTDAVARLKLVEGPVLPQVAVAGSTTLSTTG